ncbi:MAG: methionyl-tRNA formyltransferase [Patescibacteria group bacterium]
MKNKPTIVFFGTPDFSTPVLETLKKADFTPKLIIETKDEIPLERIKALKPDLLVIASFGKILKKELLALPKYGTLNVHPSLLPKYRGPSPIQAAILNGDKETGVTIILTDEKMDHGPILAQRELEIRSTKSEIRNTTYKELEKKLAELGGEFLVKTVSDWINGKIKPKEQDHSKATYTKKITKENGLINWSEPAEIIERKLRAFNPWPGAYSFWQKNNQKQRLIFFKAKIIKHRVFDNLKIGQVFKIDWDFAIQTGKDALKIEVLKPEGKKEMPSGAFLKGNSEILGQVLG